MKILSANIVIFCFAAMLVPCVAKAELSSEYLDGNYLIDSCKIAFEKNQSVSKPLDYWDAGFCTGLMRGALDSFKMLGDKLESDNALRTCIPESVNIPQAGRVVLKYLNDNPSQLHIDAFAITARALHVAYPCRT